LQLKCLGLLLDICSAFLLTADDLQFGFKAKVGCSNAIFALRSITDYFQNHSSSVFAALLDINKAFNTVNHYKFFVALSKTGLRKNRFLEVQLLLDFLVDCSLYLQLLATSVVLLN
jgi:hypothetical protein